ncbi:MAG: RNA-binding domain-containing protein [Bacteroidota bacterium]
MPIESLNRSRLTALLRETPLFADFSEDERQQIARWGERKRYERKNHIFQIDKEGKQFFLIESGKVRIRLKNGDEVTLGPRQLFGEVSAFSDLNRLGMAVTEESSVIWRFPVARIREETDTNSARAVNKLLYACLGQIAKYIHAAPELDHGTKHLVRQGESDRLEFKKTLRSAKREKIMETITGMMNTRGGVILFGVLDDGTITGLTEAEIAEIDGYIRELNNSGQNRLKNSYRSLVGFEGERVDGKVVLRIDVGASHRAVFLNYKGSPRFWIRKGGTNTVIDDFSAVVEYMIRRRALIPTDEEE